MKWYYVLWIPTLAPTSLPEIIVDQPLEDTLKDIPDLESCRLRSGLRDDRCSIDIAYSLGEAMGFENIGFCCQHRTITGLVAYEADIPEKDDAMCRSFEGRLHPSVYHFIKRHFHRHRFHDDESDSLLSAWCSIEPVNPTEPKTANIIYKHYLEQYVEKLEQYYYTVSAMYAKLLSDVDSSRFKSFLNDAKLTRKTAREASGEAQYAQALLAMSGIGTKTKLFGRLSSVIRDIDILRSKCEDLYSTHNNDYNNSLGMLGVVIGVFGILLTTGLEISHVCNDNDEDVHDELIRLKIQYDSLNETNQRILDRIKDLPLDK